MKKKSNHIAILILAAGSSSRLGRPKQLLKFHGKTLLQKAITTALEISKNVIVVLGANEKLIRPTISDFPIQIVLNKNWAEGMSSSIRTGMEFINSPSSTWSAGRTGVLIMLSDQPFVDVLLLEKLISVFEEKKSLIVASKYERKVGVPAIFNISLFEKLKNLKGQKGAKALIMNHLEQVEQVIFEKGKIDIDTEEDWEKFKKKNE